MQADRDRGKNVMPELTIILQRPQLMPANTALVVIDMVNWQACPDGGMLAAMASAGIDVTYLETRCAQTVVPNIQRLLARARLLDMKIIYTRLGCRRSDFSDTIPALRAQFRRMDACQGNWACEVVEELTPEPGDTALMKTGSSAFASSDLDAELRSSRIEHVIYTGVVTNACVLLSMGSGFDLGYYGYLVSDATATFSQRVQDTTEETVSGFMGEVLATEELLTTLGSRTGDTAAAGRTI